MYNPFRLNCISISLLDRFGFAVTLDKKILRLLFKSKVVGIRILIDGYIN